MELIKVVEKADKLFPNPYTLEEKISWCDEVSAGIRREIKKIYDIIETTLPVSGEVILPDDISFEDIEVAYINNSPISKVDFRSFIDKKEYTSPGKLRLSILTKHKPTRFITINGNFDVGENFINMENSPFCVGDLIEWVEDDGTEPNWENAASSYVIDYVYNELVLEAGSFEEETSLPLTIRRVITDTTEIEELPYESMYVEYILAKIALYQQDYTTYNAHMTQYNFLYDQLKRDYKNREPLNNLSSFRNYF